MDKCLFCDDVVDNSQMFDGFGICIYCGRHIKYVESTGYDCVTYIDNHLLLKTIQKLKDRIEVLENKVKELENGK